MIRALFLIVLAILLAMIACASPRRVLTLHSVTFAAEADRVGESAWAPGQRQQRICQRTVQVTPDEALRRAVLRNYARVTIQNLRIHEEYTAYFIPFDLFGLGNVYCLVIEWQEAQATQNKAAQADSN